MRILTVGDVCGSIGCQAFQTLVPRFKKENRIDAVLVNGENSADGNGITSYSAAFLFSCGADVITGGNHTLRRREIYETLDSNACLLRPQNLRNAEYGTGYCLLDMGRTQVAVLNLAGKVYSEKDAVDCPFAEADKLLEQARQDGAGIIVVDFHAEATSEKRALGLYLDGKVSAFYGTHTHVQTADAQILPNGTGYITDLGMTGPIQSVLGVKSSIIINRMKNKDMSKFELADGACMLNGCLFEVDEKTGKTVLAKRVYLETKN